MDRYAIIAERTWDGLADAAMVGLAVVVRGPAVDSLIPRSELPKGLPSIELQDCTLLPGLIDAHTHYSASMGASFLAAGLTTVRDTGNDLEWILRERDLNRLDPTRGPTICCCGHMLDGPEPYWHHMGRGHGDAEAIRESVRSHVTRRVDTIKLYDGLERDLLQAAVTEAHTLGKTTLAHLGKTRVEAAILAGIDEIEHLDGCPIAWRSATPAENGAFIDLLLSNNVADPIRP